MKNKRILSIDLGSAYSKIAVRRDWNADGTLLEPRDLSGEDAGFLIPSLVVEVRRDGGLQWFIGRDAAAQRPGEGIERHRYWKNRLFPVSTTATGRPSDESTRSPQETSTDRSSLSVAIRFFTELRRAFMQDPALASLCDLPVRVGVPALGSRRDSEELMEHVLAESGWEEPEARATITEPEANLWGLLTRGQNVTWLPPKRDFQPWEGRSVDMSQMVENVGFFRKMRKVRGTYRVLVTDLGAFTTDFGLVEVDASFTADWKRPKVRQQSVKLGIRDLDGRVYEDLAEEEQKAVGRLSTQRWERRKAQMYAGSEIALRHPEGGIIQLGGGAHRDRVRDAISWFAERVIEERERFLRDRGITDLNANVISGGGAMITDLREEIEAACSAADDEDFDLFDEELARNVLKRAGRETEANVEQRVRKNRQLVRGAGALGGASVVAE